MPREQSLAEESAAPVTRPAAARVFRLRKVPDRARALGPDMRSDCVRCGTSLRRTRRDPLNRCLALTAAALVLFAVVWLAMLMKVSTAGIEHATTLISGRLSWSSTACGRWRWWVAFTTAFAPFAKFAGTLYVLVGSPPAHAAAQPPRRFPVRPQDGHLGDVGGASAGRVRWPTPSSATWSISRSARPSMHLACSR